MIYDPLDFFILTEILKGETTTWKIGEDFNWENKPNFKIRKDKDIFFTNKCGLICKRLKQMSKEGIVEITKNGGNRNVYVVNEKKVILKKQRFPNIYSKALLIKGFDNKWSIFEL